MNLLTQLLRQFNRFEFNRHDVDRLLSYFKTIARPISDGLSLREPEPGEMEFGVANSFLEKPIIFPQKSAVADWPIGEFQFKFGTETMACVTHACENHIQAVQKRKYGIIDNRSERFTAKMSGTTRNGNNASNVLNSIRKDRTVPEERWPFADGMTWDQYYSPIPPDVIQEALRWGYGINHWPVDMLDYKMREAAHARFGSIIVAGDAWYMKNGMYYSPAPGRYVHMFDVVEFRPKGEKQLAGDSYVPFFKELAADYDFYRWGYVADIFKIAGNTDGEKLYNTLLGKEILLVEQAEEHVPGEAYRLYPEYWDKTQIIISDKKLFDVANTAWRANKSFVGVNAKVFFELKHYYEERFGSLKVEEPKILFGVGELLLDPKVVG